MREDVKVENVTKQDTSERAKWKGKVLNGDPTQSGRKASRRRIMMTALTLQI